MTSQWTKQGPANQSKIHFCLPSRSLHKLLSLIHQRTDRRSKKKHSLIEAKTKTILEKINYNEKAVMFQIKGKIKPQKID